MLNTVSIIGNLGADPDVRYTQSGLAVSNLNVAVSEFYRDQSGESQKRTHWFRAVAFGRTAEIAGDYLKKGSKVGIGGQLVTREWHDQNGQNRRTVEIRINQLELLGNNGNAAQNSNGNANGQHSQSPAQQQQTRSRQPTGSRPPGQLPPGEDLPEPPPYDPADDIPF